jgi:EmrB/QacA subfamily drug resistance transporter
VSTLAAVSTAPPSTPNVRTGTRAGALVIAAVVLGSGMAFLDTTVVNVALPALADDLGVGFSALQWVLDGYLLTLGSLLLLGGVLGDRLGRRRVFVYGLVLFAIASAACGAAPNVGFLIGARLVQGVGAAAMVPGSLAIIGGAFVRQERAEAIGSWTAWSAVTTALGPLLGGWLVDAVSWRWVFLINAPLALLTLWLTLRYVPESRDEAAADRLDVTGAVTATLGLGGVVFGLIEGPVRGFSSPLAAGALALGTLLLASFVVTERRRRHPMLPLELFAERRFSGANLATLAVYAALNVVLFLVVLQLQTGLGYSALAAGAALFPINVALLTLSSRAGRWAECVGHHVPMTVGPVIAAVGLLLMTRIQPGATYLVAVLPAVVVFGLGLATTVAPLTAAAIAAVADRHTGVASGINNAVARVAGLVAVASVPLVAGISGTGDVGGGGLGSGFARAMVIAAGLLIAGAVIAATTVRSPPSS